MTVVAKANQRTGIIEISRVLHSGCSLGSGWQRKPKPRFTLALDQIDRAMKAKRVQACHPTSCLRMVDVPRSSQEACASPAGSLRLLAAQESVFCSRFAPNAWCLVSHMSET